MARRILLLLLLAGALGIQRVTLAAGPSGSPSPQVAAAQTLLRRERVFLGEINGILDMKTVAAVRRFQILHGLRVTGRLDEATLAGMHLPPPAPPPNVMEEDRKFLRQSTPHR